MDTADAEAAESQQPTADELREKIRQLRERKDRYEGLMRERARTGQRQGSLTDPDRRAMPKSPNVDVGDTAQVADDAKHQLFVVQEMTTAVTDGDRLGGIAIQAQEVWGG